MNGIDDYMDEFVGLYGFHATVAALARYASRNGMKVAYRRLNKLYEYLCVGTGK
jgi:hypothetical protein